MATRFVNIDRDTPLLLPPDLRDWVPVSHLAHFIIDAVEALDVRHVKVNTRGTGDEQYPPGPERNWPPQGKKRPPRPAIGPRAD